MSAEEVALAAAVMTVTSTLPAASVGAVARMDVWDRTENPSDGVAPKFTLVTPAKPAPVIVTWAPPPAGPCPGVMELTTGTYENRSAAGRALLPADVVTATLTVPVPGGATAVIELGPDAVNRGGVGSEVDSGAGGEAGAGDGDGGATGGRAGAGGHAADRREGPG